jgi:hypothetical protein
MLWREPSRLPITMSKLTREADHDLIAAAESLRVLGLPPWRVQRIVRRVPSDRQSSPSYDDMICCRPLGTTAGLLCDAALRVSPRCSNSFGRPSSVVLRSRHGSRRCGLALQICCRAGFDSLKGARRAVQHRSGDQLKQLQQVLEKSRIEGSALQGHAKLARAEESLTAELQQCGR